MAGCYCLNSILIKQREMCLRALEVPTMPCMEWLPVLGIQGDLLMLKIICLVSVVSEVILRLPEAIFF